jgi:hypothetical protein
MQPPVKIDEHEVALGRRDRLGFRRWHLAALDAVVDRHPAVECPAVIQIFTKRAKVEAAAWVSAAVAVSAVLFEQLARRKSRGSCGIAQARGGQKRDHGGN